jgi:hypothetical protein
LTSGVVVLEVTLTWAVEVQPLAGLVTVKIKVPLVFTVGVAVLPPLTIPVPPQEKVAPGVEDEPSRVTVVAEQVSVLSLPALALGGVVLEEILTWAVLVHPLAGLVTVSVYVPFAFTTGIAVFPPLTMPGPLQEKVAPEVDEEPSSVTVVAVQVRVLLLPAMAFGGVVLEVTVTCAVLVQPLEGSVTVSI